MKDNLFSDLKSVFTSVSFYNALRNPQDTFAEKPEMKMKMHGGTLEITLTIPFNMTYL